MKKRKIVDLSVVLITISFTAAQAQVPVMVKDINPGPASSTILQSPVAAWQNTFFFCADDGVSGWELWKSDGTNSGTVMVKDIHPTMGSSCVGFQYVDSIMYFSASNGLFLDTLFGPNDTILGIYERRTLWKTDGTENGTVMIKDVRMVTNMVSLNSEAYFLAYDGLWKTDGTESGTYLVKPLLINTSGYFQYLHEIVVFKNKLYFHAAESSQYNYELWTSDGTENGTIMIKDINATPQYGSIPQNFVVFQDELYFAASTGGNGGSGGFDPSSDREMWKTDGSEAGTVMVKDIRPGGGSSSPTLYGVMGGYLYFTAYDSIYYPGWNYNRELWKTDGTENGTVMVRDINYHKPEPLPWGTGGNSSPSNVIFMNNMVFATATDDSNNNISNPPLFTSRDIWKSDGTDAGTMKLTNIDTNNTFNGQGKPRDLIVAGTKFYFKASAESGNYGVELWESDGTSSGTMMVADLYPGSESGEPQLMTYIDGYLYFTLDNGTEGRELWRIVSPTGINEQMLNDETNFSIYPNPSIGQFTLEMRVKEAQEIVVKIMTILGQEVFVEKRKLSPGIHRKEIDIQTHAKGIYLLQVMTRGGMTSKKILLQ